jgi:hypothetical protein
VWCSSTAGTGLPPLPACTISAWFLVLLTANYGLISALNALSVAALPAKVLAEIARLAVSYAVQQRYFFSGNTASTSGRNADNQALDLNRGHHPGTLRR